MSNKQAIPCYHVLQEVSHIIIQRSAGLDVDLDQVATMLCQELQDAAGRDALLSRLQTSVALERDLGNIAIAEVSMLNFQLQERTRELEAVNVKLCQTKVSLVLNFHSTVHQPESTSRHRSCKV